MGLVMKKSDTEELRRIAERERAPFYVIGEVSGKGNFTLRDSKTGNAPIDLELSDMFGSTPKTVMHGSSPKGGADGHGGFAPLRQTPAGMSPEALTEAIRKVLMLESVACKDWLTNKVDRSVTGLIACQQCCGELQLPLNDLGVTAIGYDDPEGIAVSIGHAPAAAMIDPAAGSRLAIAEALTNIIWTPIRDNIYGISLSANWMWPCRNQRFCHCPGHQHPHRQGLHVHDPKISRRGEGPLARYPDYLGHRTEQGRGNDPPSRDVPRRGHHPALHSVRTYY